MSKHDIDTIDDNKLKNEPVNRYGQPITVRSRIFRLSMLIGLFLFVFLGITRFMPKEPFITTIVAGAIFLIFAVVIFFLIQDGKKKSNNNSDDLDT